MASKKQKAEAVESQASQEVDDIAKMLIKDLNVEMGTRVAYNLACDIAPTHVKRWMSTGCLSLDYAISNRANGGVPEGRIIEISGLPSTGKSHIAFQLARTCQLANGLVIYIDTENAVPLEKLAHMGINVKKRFIYCDTHRTEEVFTIVESLIEKTRALKEGGKDFPILVVWDSVAATSPGAELDGEYDKDTMGLQARVISKAMRKITGVIGHNDVTFVCLNQLRMKLNLNNKYEDPYISPGGNAIPFHSTIRIRLGSGSPVKDKRDNVIGTHVTCKIVKNKIAPPFRKIDFNILFGKGIDDNDFLFDSINDWHKSRDKADREFVTQDGHRLYCGGDGPWKQFIVSTADGENLHEVKFYKADFTSKILNDPDERALIQPLLDVVLLVNLGETAPDEEMTLASAGEKLEPPLEEAC